MKNEKEYSGQYLVSDSGNRLVILTRTGAKNPGHCYYFSRNFGEVIAHQKRGFNPLDPKVEWEWAKKVWGKKPASVSKDEVLAALKAIKWNASKITHSSPLNRKSFTGRNVATAKPFANQSMVEFRAGLEKKS